MITISRQAVPIPKHGSPTPVELVTGPNKAPTSIPLPFVTRHIIHSLATGVYHPYSSIHHPLQLSSAPVTSHSSLPLACSLGLGTINRYRPPNLPMPAHFGAPSCCWSPYLSLCVPPFVSLRLKMTQEGCIVFCDHALPNNWSDYFIGNSWS